MRAFAIAALVLAVSAQIARADDNPKRKVVVLEYRSGSAALIGISSRFAAAMSKLTSLDVVSPEQAKTLYGEQLVQTVVRCAGEAECVSKVGAKLGAAEVVVIGVSELGDVILTMQRIEVRSHTVLSRIADSLGSDAHPSDDQVELYLKHLLPPGDFVRFGVIDIRSSEGGAVVTVGDTRRGTTPLPPLKLEAPATYAVKVEKRGFVPFTTTVQLPPDVELKVDANLAVRGGGSHWYQKWYVLTAAGLLVAGAAGGTIYFATQRDDSSLNLDGVIR